ncbi:hypothetical protein NDU88_010657 [Pleurodeles waltl]|uniref:Uncharacterized protein n=1 Tax=Pleurodeles waltl TaxID=8319 RepID=A0AAV7S200_PLEWA|nr:hypothetical protein NDU88_010657 [Pleurodeles waltl]
MQPSEGRPPAPSAGSSGKATSKSNHQQAVATFQVGPTCMRSWNGVAQQHEQPNNSLFYPLGALSPGPHRPVPQPGAPQAVPHRSCAGAGPRLPRSTVPENTALRTAVHPGASASTATHLMWAHVLPQPLLRRRHPHGPDVAAAHSTSTASSSRLALAGNASVQRCAAGIAVEVPGRSGRLRAVGRQVCRYNWPLLYDAR